uniref:DNA-directed RNA polymerase n=1 Tax=Eutreptiella gymnastica TaxID=73025 RepID=A0A7S1IXA0_9EUGL|mmetsp:Transcript_49037/g.87423  ORF Transcript_49037/g.87423 Transcript_49037/m.87423 type:complete len:871 (+) Transcript_49037:34-2646(+)
MQWLRYSLPRPALHVRGPPWALRLQCPRLLGTVSRCISGVGPGLQCATISSRQTPKAPEELDLLVGEDVDHYAQQCIVESMEYRRLRQCFSEKLGALREHKDVAARLGTKKLFNSLIVPLSQAIKAEQINCVEGFQEMFRSLDANTLALITLQELVALCVTGTRQDGDVTLPGRTLQAMARQRIAEELKMEWRMRLGLGSDGPRKNGRKLQLRQLKLKARRMKSHHDEGAPKVADIILQVVKSHPNLCMPMTVNGKVHWEDVFEWTHQTIALNPRVLELINDELVRGNINFLVRSKVPIMVSQPLPWQGSSSPYYSVNVDIMRTKGLRVANELLGTANTGPWRAALDTLSTTKWKVNEWILEVMDTLHQQGLPVGKMPGNDVDVEAEDDLPETATFREIKEHESRRNSALKKNAELHTLRSDFLLKIIQAKRLKGVPQLYIPHNADFRGRAYPLHPHLQHMGSDVPRGLLCFAEAKPIGERGLHWLYVQLANTYGKDKLSINDRVAFVKANLQVIMECASTHENACAADSWWKAAEKPFQCLATCREIFQAHQLPDPHKYQCGLPVHADGSCNGLQHFVALSRDDVGAKPVNMTGSSPDRAPQDAYTGVLDVVLQIIDKDALEGHPVASKVQGHVARKTIKQTVMTTVYGVTHFGGVRQIFRQLKAQGPPGMTDAEMFSGATYLTSAVMQSLGVVFRRAQEVQDWMRRASRQIVKETGRPMSWTTPLGIPVVQPYVRQEAFDIHRKTTGDRIKMDAVLEFAQPDYRKQASAFPPNYVHSVDSSHMYLTALECNRQGVTFAGVHDSFWTHPGSMDTMQAITRQQFVALHSQPLLQRLRSSLELQYGVSLEPLPEPGMYDVNEVLDAQYFFS